MPRPDCQLFIMGNLFDCGAENAVFPKLSLAEWTDEV